MNWYLTIQTFRQYFIANGRMDLAEDCNKLLTDMDNADAITIHPQEAKDLMEYFLKCGHISHEFHQPVHDFCDKLSKFLEGRS